MKLFWFGNPKPKPDELETMYEAEITKTQKALFEVRLELESAEAREVTLVKRLTRLTEEQNRIVVSYPPLHKVG